MPACGGGATEGGAKDATDEGKKDEASSDDPVVELKNISEGLQKEVDSVFEPIKTADAVIDGVAGLPKELKAAKSKADPKKLMAEAQKLLETGDYNLEAVGLVADEKAKVQEKFDKLKALVNSIKTMDEKVKSLGGKITDAVTKIPTVGAKAVAKAELTLKNPLAGGESKKKAEADKKAIMDIVDGFKTKATGWQKDITELPPKAKDLPAKMSKAFKG